MGFAVERFCSRTNTGTPSGPLQHVYLQNPPGGRSGYPDRWPEHTEGLCRYQTEQRPDDDRGFANMTQDNQTNQNYLIWPGAPPIKNSSRQVAHLSRRISCHGRMRLQIFGERRQRDMCGATFFYISVHRYLPVRSIEHYGRGIFSGSICNAGSLKD